jgi:hypothetical protein
MPVPETSALVVFSGQTDIGYLKLLKPGFRHCFVILKLHDRWISIDPLAHMTRIDLHKFYADNDLNSLLSESDLTVVPTHLREAALVPSPPMLCTCVEVVKRILGIQCWHVLTPWQLYRYLSH